MKRARDDDIDAGGNRNCFSHGEEEDGDDHRRAACDVLLSLSCGPSSASSSEESAAGMAAAPRRNKRHRHVRRGREVFECRTCGREFATFQALGGHRTSHLRRPAAAKLRPKPMVVHECATCGMGFSTGQALGGHMRRHRRAAATEEEDCGYVGLTNITMDERPSSASLKLLNLFM